jgi:biotin carboxylase
MINFSRGLAEVGAAVYGVGDTHPNALPDRVKPYLAGYLQVPRVMDEDDVMNRASDWLRGKHIDRVLTNWEPLVMLAAKLRERWGIPGMSVNTCEAFRDKQIMKERISAAGLRVPKSRRVHNRAEIYAMVEEIGYPVILKPIAGAGCADTFHIKDRAELEHAINMIGHRSEASCEEYIEGGELTYDTLCIDGRPMMENVSQYFPKPLEARTVEWISPMSISIRDTQQETIKRGIELGRGVLKALEMGDGFTHMEWYLTPKGEAVFGEIACRPGGAGLVDQMNYTYDADFFREWARISCWHHYEGPFDRKYNVGIVFKRAKGRGTITRIDGLRQFHHDCGKWLVEDTLLRPGTPRRDWKQTQVSDGHIMVRHPDWDTAMKMCQMAAANIHMYAQ